MPSFRLRTWLAPGSCARPDVDRRSGLGVAHRHDLTHGQATRPGGGVEQQQTLLGDSRRGAVEPIAAEIDSHRPPVEVRDCSQPRDWRLAASSEAMPASRAPSTADRSATRSIGLPTSSSSEVAPLAPPPACRPTASSR